MRRHALGPGLVLLPFLGATCAGCGLLGFEARTSAASADAAAIDGGAGGADADLTGADARPGGGRTLLALGFTSRRVYAFSVDDELGLAGATLTGEVSVAAQEPAPNKVRVGGNKLFVMGETGNQVFQYSLGPSFTAISYDGVALTLSPSEANPRGLAFRPDGLRMYVVGVANDLVMQYALPTAWSLTGASNAGGPATVAEDALPTGVTFDPSGLRMFIAGRASARVLQYHLSAPYELATAVWSGAAIDLAGVQPMPTDLAWSASGRTLVVCGQASSRVVRFALTTPWDLSTATLTTDALDVSALDLNLRGLATP